MKKTILAVILLAAAGGAAYYLLQKKKTDAPLSFNKELLTGPWKIDSMVGQNVKAQDAFALLLFAMDSAATERVYDFQPDGNVLISLPSDTLAKKDTSSFSWGEGDAFLWKEKHTDSIAEPMTVIRLDKENFVFQSTDSIRVYLRKVK